MREVIFYMDRKYDTLSALLDQDPDARAFYDRLPDYVRQQMAAREDSINSFESLSDYVDNLTRGDG